MSTKEIERVRKEIQAQTVLVSKDKEAAKAYLIEAGILTKKGNLKRAFRGLKRVQG